MLIGAGGFLIVFFLVNVVIVVAALRQDRDFTTEDIGPVLEKVNAVAKYGDRRLASAAEGMPLPEPPEILANQDSLRIGLLATLGSQVLLFGVVGAASKQNFRELVSALGMNRFGLGRIWLVGACVIAAYAGTFVYSLGAEAIGIGWLQPEPTVGTEIVRQELTLSIAAVVILVGAPISEELFFRGLVFSGLSKWGFWPAAAISALGFSLVHFNPGSVIPFFGIGVLMAWLYWRRGSLWDSILFHFIFNALSFSILVAISR